ncbi:MAG: hypothetical protein AB9834_11495 [Lentimicrobium sp.]
MKAFKIILAGLILTGLLSCDPVVTFTEPQPEGTDNLLKFPKRLQGLYLSTEDSSTLQVDNRLMRRVYDVGQKIHPNQLSSEEKLMGDTLINLATNEKIPVRIDGDSIIYSLNFIDTLFRIDTSNVVRKYKGYYFLNSHFGKNGWEVKKLQLTKGQLVISSITEQSDIDNLKAVVETVQDTVLPFRFKATRKQFKKYVRNNGFSNHETFLRQKKN